MSALSTQQTWEELAFRAEAAAMLVPVDSSFRGTATYVVDPTCGFVRASRVPHVEGGKGKDRDRVTPSQREVSVVGGELFHRSLEEHVMATDAALIRESVTRPERFGDVFDRYASDMFGFLARRVGSEQAEDLVAELFRIAFERRGSFDVARDDARPWLYGIASKLVLKHRSAEVRRLRVFPVRPAHEQPTAEEQVVAAEAATDIGEAVAALPPGEREVLLLAVWEELSYDDIAIALDIPIGTVRSRLNRARTRLRERARETKGAEPHD